MLGRGDTWVMVRNAFGMSETTLLRWNRHPEFVAEVARVKGEIAAEVTRKGIAVKQARLDRYVEIDRRLWQIVEERAADESLADVPGGGSGFMVRTTKIAANGDTIDEYQVDTGHERAIRANMQQLAQELGEWDADDVRVGDRLERRYIGVNVQVVLGANGNS